MGVFLYQYVVICDEYFLLNLIRESIPTKSIYGQ